MKYIIVVTDDGQVSIRNDSNEEIVRYDASGPASCEEIATDDEYHLEYWREPETKTFSFAMMEINGGCGGRLYQGWARKTGTYIATPTGFDYTADVSAAAEPATA